MFKTNLGLSLSTLHTVIKLTMLYTIKLTTVAIIMFILVALTNTLVLE